MSWRLQLPTFKNVQGNEAEDYGGNRGHNQHYSQAKLADTYRALDPQEQGACSSELHMNHHAEFVIH